MSLPTVGKVAVKIDKIIWSSFKGDILNDRSCYMVTQLRNLQRT